MKRLFNILLALLLGIGILSATLLPSYAQIEEDTALEEVEIVEETDLDDVWEIADVDLDSPFSLSADITEDNLEEFVEDFVNSAALLFGGIIFIIALGVSLSVYIYTAVALMGIAKKLDHPNGWFAWIPILNSILLLQMGEKSPWLILTILIPGLGTLVFLVISILAIMDICEKRGYDKLLGLLILVPLGNLILFGILAWGKNS